MVFLLQKCYEFLLAFTESLQDQSEATRWFEARSMNCWLSTVVPFCQIGTTQPSGEARVSKKRSVRRKMAAKEGRNILEFSNFKVSINKRVFLRNTKNGHFD